LEAPDDDLLDDLMHIVQNDDADPSKGANPNPTTKSGTIESEHENEFYENSDDEEEDGEYECDDEEENLIDQMLEKPIDMLDEKEQCNFYTYDKIQIKHMYWRGCQDTILPEGWVQVTHACGMPLYLNRQTRVCTLSRPYYISEASARKHDIPISAIPCMAYRRRKEAVEKQIKEHNQAKCKPAPDESGNQTEMTVTEQVSLKCPFGGAGGANPQDEFQMNKKVVVSIQTNDEKLKESILAPEQVHEYCKKLFDFDVIKVKKFKTWGDRKKFVKRAKQKSTSKFPENAKMLKIQTKTQKGLNKELNINMTNKTALSILYEYASQVHKSNPRFEIQEKENPKDPFHAVCYINDKCCGKGSGNSKKTAKNNAAEAALAVLIPDYKGEASDSQKNSDDTTTFFDDFPVEHSHIYMHSQKLGSPLPYDVLLTCLKYNFAVNMARNQKQFIEEEIKPIKYRNCLYRMKLAQYEVEVNCTKKKEGRQLAAQKILQQMHPHINTWGSLLRLYGSKMTESYLNGNPVVLDNDSTAHKKAKSSVKPPETGSNTNTGDSQNAKPNKELLEKLKEEMRKIKRPATVESGDKSGYTLLSIPPLLLGNGEFTLGSCSYLMTSDIKRDVSTLKENDEDKIMFAKDKCDSSPIQEASKKRKLKKYSDEESNDDTEDSSDDDDDDSNSNKSDSFNNSN